MWFEATYWRMFQFICSNIVFECDLWLFRRLESHLLPIWMIWKSDFSRQSEHTCRPADRNAHNLLDVSCCESTLELPTFRTWIGQAQVVWWVHVWMQEDRHKASVHRSLLAPHHHLHPHHFKSHSSPRGNILLAWRELSLALASSSGATDEGWHSVARLGFDSPSLWWVDALMMHGNNKVLFRRLKREAQSIGSEQKRVLLVSEATNQLPNTNICSILKCPVFAAQGRVQTWIVMETWLRPTRRAWLGSAEASGSKLQRRRKKKEELTWSRRRLLIEATLTQVALLFD